MKNFLDENFLLQTKTAQRLYHDYAAGMPIIDYHCHLPPDQIANDINFENLTGIWLKGDHYKWRAMRTNGVDEEYITGNKNDFEKFEKWAETVPYTLRNPLYHWTHLELQRYFNINELLSPATAKKIYDDCSEKLRSKEYSVRNLIVNKNVELICTTDDPLDDLSHHQKIKKDGYKVQLLPAFRPDKAMNTNDLPALNGYINQLEAITNTNIDNFDSYLIALKSRHDYFAENGCKLSDHGLEQLYADDYTDEEIALIFLKIKSNQVLLPAEITKFKSAMLYHFALWDHEKGWTQQYHLGALRNNSTRSFTQLGPDTGGDSIADFAQAKSMSKFLDRLDTENKLTKTILYNLNPADNEVMAAMTCNFNDGTIAGKIQFGSAWCVFGSEGWDDQTVERIVKYGIVESNGGDADGFEELYVFPPSRVFSQDIMQPFW